MDTALVVRLLAGLGVGLLAISVALRGMALSVARLKGKGNRSSPALMALGSALNLPESVLHHSTVYTAMNVAVMIWYGMDWWRNGGGDGTKRRLKKVAKKFEGVRRTAPQGA